jgi:hypothetical protein
MEFVIRLLGALVITYALSRGLIRLFGSRAKQEPLPLIGIHLLSFAILAVAVGLIRAYWSSFNWSAAAFYAAPQFVWLLIDVARLRVR